MSLIDDFARRHETAVVRRGGEIFVAVEVAGELVDEAESRGIGVLGIEGFVIGEFTYPALSRIADFSRQRSNPSRDFVAWSCGEVRRLLAGPWRVPPSGADDQIHSAAIGRYMFAFVFDDGS